jgi:putative hydrolase of HD superfamily
MSLPERELAGILEFVRELDSMKWQLRTAWSRHGRQESVAEHSWRLAMMVIASAHLVEGIDPARAVELALIHDLGEALEGDTSAKLATDAEAKLKRERRSVEHVTSHLDGATRQSVIERWREYNEGTTSEALLVKALDKMETIIAHNHGWNPEGFDHQFNLTYGRELAAFHPDIQRLRDLVDADTRRSINESSPPPRH